jgi:hypothetical protein
MDRTARCTGARLALALFTLCLTLLPSIAAGAPAPVALSALALLPGDARIAPAAGTQESPRIAAGGGGYLVVWADQRSALTMLVAFSGGPYLSPEIGSMRDIYAARLDASGALLDATPILVAQQTLNQGFPDVAWNGQNWLVSWSGQTDMACCPNARIFAARVSPAGTLLDPTPIAVATESQVDGWYGPAVASDGTNWAVVYRTWGPAGVSMLVGRRLAPDGTVLDATAAELRHDTWNSYPIHPDLVFAGDEYMLVWTENFPTGLEGAVRGQRLTPALARLGGPISLNLYTPSTGKSARVTHAGAVQDPAGIAVTPFSAYAQLTPQVAWDGTRWIVGYHTSDLLVRRVSASGTLLDASGLVVKPGAGANAQPTMVARPGGGVRFAWMDSRAAGPEPEDIYTISASATGAPGAEACVSLAAPRQTDARLVAGGSGHLLVFLSRTSGVSSILAERLDARGAPLDAEPIELATGANLVSPAAAWNGSLFLVTWQDATQNTVSARRLRADGSLADPAPIAIMTAFSPVVAALGDNFLVAGVFNPNPELLAPRYVRVRGSDGVKLDATPFVLGRYFAVSPTLARLGSRWLLMWEEHPTHDDPTAKVVGVFVAADGSASSTFAMTTFDPGAEFEPSLGTGRDTALVVWQDARGGNAGSEIYAQRLLPDGTRLDGNGLRLTAAVNNQRTPEVAWNGSEFIVGYGDDRNEGTPGIQQFRGDVYASRIDARGDVLDVDGFAVSRDSVMECDPIAGGSAGALIVGCSVFESAAPFANYRVGLRTAEPGVTAVGDRGVGGTSGLRVAPNPFFAETRLTFALARAGRLRAAVHDLQGREVRSLCDRAMPAGRVDLAWDGRDARGVRVASGVYTVLLTVEGHSTAVRVARLR